MKIMSIKLFTVTYKSYASGDEWTEKICADDLYMAMSRLNGNPSNIMSVTENGVPVSSEKLTELFDSLAARSTV